jgi:flavorubredoxin
MSIQLTDDVHSIYNCDPVKGRHVHNSVYLIAGDANLLVDTGTGHDRNHIMAEIDAITDGEGLDGIIISHPDLPHIANAKHFVDTWDVETYSPIANPEAQGLYRWGGGTRRIVKGSDMIIQGRKFYASEKILADRPNTCWLYDYESGVYVTGDGFGNYHDPAACGAMFDGIDDESMEQDIKQYNRDKLTWLRYMQAALVRQSLERLVAKFDISYVAPIHGNPIAGQDVATYLDYFEASVEEIAAEYTGPEATNPSLLTY